MSQNPNNQGSHSTQPNNFFQGSGSHFAQQANPTNFWGYSHFPPQNHGLYGPPGDGSHWANQIYSGSYGWSASPAQQDHGYKGGEMNMGGTSMSGAGHLQNGPPGVGVDTGNPASLYGAGSLHFPNRSVTFSSETNGKTSEISSDQNSGEVSTPTQVDGEDQSEQPQTPLPEKSSKTDSETPCLSPQSTSDPAMLREYLTTTPQTSPSKDRSADYHTPPTDDTAQEPEKQVEISLVDAKTAGSASTAKRDMKRKLAAAISLRLQLVALSAAIFNDKKEDASSCHRHKRARHIREDEEQGEAVHEPSSDAKEDKSPVERSGTPENGTGRRPRLRKTFEPVTREPFPTAEEANLWMPELQIIV
ncbi:hypothetical protein IWZ01DRAFT_515894 [Phyllosticta capitalensis]